MPPLELDAPVRLGLGDHRERGERGWADLALEARGAAGDPGAALALAHDLSLRVPTPGHGGTRDRWEALATLGMADLTVARTLEPHLDALAIRGEAELTSAPTGSTWAVWAAEAPHARLAARSEGGEVWLDGRKAWCSLAELVSHAVLTAWVDDERRGLFEIELTDPGVRALPSTWVSRGLPQLRTPDLELSHVRARPVGGPDWYLRRPGFGWGGLGVAAVWFGGAVTIARRLRLQAEQRPLDQVGQAWLGAVDADLWAARAVLAEAACAVDEGRATGSRGALLAMRTRQVVAEAVERVVSVAERALGPGPLTQEERYAAAVSDLRVYLRQHHAARDAAALARAACSTDRSEADPW